jgi:hypothetical protein
VLVIFSCIEEEDDLFQDDLPTTSCGDYQSAVDDIQLDSYCGAAFAAECAGDQSAKDQACLYWNSLVEYYDGPTPSCSYCN